MSLTAIITFPEDLIIAVGGLMFIAGSLVGWIVRDMIAGGDKWGRD